MDDGGKELDLFTTRVRQLILQYNELEKENVELHAALDGKEARISQLEAQLAQARNDYDSLKMARMLEITDGEMAAAQKRIAKLIRDVDKCITLISEK